MVILALEGLVSSGHLFPAYEIVRKASADNWEVAAWIERHADRLYAPFLYELARRRQESDPETAAKWHYAGILWATYDARRCKNPTAGQRLKALEVGLGPLVAWRKDHRSEDAAAAEAALEWEHNHPSRQMQPAWICIHGTMAYHTLPEEKKL